MLLLSFSFLILLSPPNSPVCIFIDDGGCIAIETYEFSFTSILASVIEIIIILWFSLQTGRSRRSDHKVSLLKLTNYTRFIGFWSIKISLWRIQEQDFLDS